MMLTPRGRTEIIVETHRVLIVRRTYRQTETAPELQIETKSQNWRRITMVGRMLKRAVLGLFVLTLACITLLAQSGPKIGHSTNHSGTSTPPAPPAAGLVTIFSNMFPVTGNMYNDTVGYYVAGPDNSISGLSEQWISIPFTPAANAHVEELQLAVGIISGTSRFDVTLASDDGGIPGTSLGTKSVTVIPEWGKCCKLVTVKFKAPGIAVTAGTQYWIVATPDDVFAPDFTGIWAFSNLDWVGYNVGQAGWATIYDSDWPAGNALGTIP
jgi:hypothetical protein